MAVNDNTGGGGWGDPAKTAGTYWKGADGNVWVSGAQGVNNAGKVDANTNAYWNGLGYQEVFDPAGYGKAGDIAGIDGGGGYAGPTQAQLDAQKAAGLRGGIRNLVGNITSIYDTIYGDLSRIAGDQKDQLQKRYNTETGALADQFNQELPAIGKGYASKGLYDSSYRQGAEGRATEGYTNQIQGVGQQLEADMGKVGQALATSQAQIANDRGGLQALLNSLDSVTDLNELTQLQNQIDQKLRNAQQTQATNKSQSEFVAQLNQAAPTAPRLGELQTVLTNIIQGQAPRGLKIQTAQEIIGSSGLSEEDKNKLTQTFNAQV